SFATLVHSRKTFHASRWIASLSTPRVWVMISSRSSPQWVTNESTRSFPLSALSICAAVSSSLGWVRESPGKLPTSALMTEIVVRGIRVHSMRSHGDPKNGWEWRGSGGSVQGLPDGRCGAVRAECPEKDQAFRVGHRLHGLAGRVIYGVDLFIEFFYCHLAVAIEDLAVLFPGISGPVFFQSPVHDILVEGRLVDLQDAIGDILPECPDISLDDIALGEVQVDEVPRGAGDAVLGNTDVEVMVPQSLGDLFCAVDIDRELLDHVPVRIVRVAVGAAVSNCYHVRENVVLVEGLDEPDGFLGPGQDQAFCVFPPDLAHLYFKAELLSFHLLFDVAGDIRGGRDVLGQFLADVLSLKVEEVRGIDGKRGVPGFNLRIDQLLCPLYLGSIAFLDGDMIGVQRPDIATCCRCRRAHFIAKDLRGHAGIPAGEIGFGPCE